MLIIYVLLANYVSLDITIIGRIESDMEQYFINSMKPHCFTDG